eukprot:4468572-Prorocentrum_lima.AAC.1
MLAADLPVRALVNAGAETGEQGAGIPEEQGTGIPEEQGAVMPEERVDTFDVVAKALRPQDGEEDPSDEAESQPPGVARALQSLSAWGQASTRE